MVYSLSALKEMVMEYLDRMFSLKGKKVVITGGGGVIARVLSEALLSAGASLSLWGRSQKSLDDAVKKLASHDRGADNLYTVVVDTADEPAVLHALSLTEQELVIPHIQIN